METLSVVTPPAVLPVTLEAMKLHLRVEADATEEDSLITALIAAATDLVEARTKRAFINRTLAWTVDGFPSLSRPSLSGNLPLSPPCPPLVSVTSIGYLKPDNTLATLDPSDYRVLAGVPAQIVPAAGKAWPTVQRSTGVTKVTYIAGYGPDETTVPPAIVAAIKLTVGSWYRNREAVTPGAMTELPLGVRSLLNSNGWGFYG